MNKKIDEVEENTINDNSLDENIKAEAKVTNVTRRGLSEDDSDAYAEETVIHAEDDASNLSEEEKLARIVMLKPIVEGAIMASGGTLTLKRIQSLFEAEELPSLGLLIETLKSIKLDCEGRGFDLVEVGTGWRFQVREQFATWVNRLWDEKPQKYSRALLETLALIAYRQPLTRGDIEEVRGVAVSSHIIKTLVEREWVKVVGTRDVPGRPSLYATTKQFLDYFNLSSLEELPTLGELKDIDNLNASLDLHQQIPEEVLTAVREGELVWQAEVENDPMAVSEAKSEAKLEEGAQSKFESETEIKAEAGVESEEEVEPEEEVEAEEDLESVEELEVDTESELELGDEEQVKGFESDLVNGVSTEESEPSLFSSANIVQHSLPEEENDKKSNDVDSDSKEHTGLKNEK